MWTKKVLIFKDIKNSRWTIWSLDRKKHLGYADELFVKNAQFVVVEEKRVKVIKSKKRFPHAWVIGEIVKSPFKASKEVTYNPFTMKQFQTLNGQNKLTAKKVVMSPLGKVFI